MWYRLSKNSAAALPECGIIALGQLNIVSPVLPPMQQPDVPGNNESNPVDDGDADTTQPEQGDLSEMPSTSSVAPDIIYPQMHERCHCVIKRMLGGNMRWERNSSTPCEVCDTAMREFNAKQAQEFGFSDTSKTPQILEMKNKKKRFPSISPMVNPFAR